MTNGLIFDIQRFCIHNGPGIRTTVFFKGCTMACFWCHNPESIAPKPELQVFPDKCIGCLHCVKVCPTGAQTIKDRVKLYNRTLCQACGRCARVCHAGASVLIGRYMTPQEVMQEVEKDIPFYKNSGGGVTLSGGEPLMQADFAREILQICHLAGIHAAVETASNVSYTAFEQVLPYTDLFLCDIKLMDPDKHKAVTGHDNRRIPDNISNLSRTGLPIIIRIPVIPGVNDEVEEIAAIGAFVKGLDNMRYIELLPFHRLGDNKYTSLGKEYRAANLTPPSKETMDALVRVLTDAGLTVKAS